MSWDNNNLYIGKIGGNNAQGGMIYLHADFAGASFDSIHDIIYDGLKPDFSAMGGVNFNLYFKNGYDEYRTWNGTEWSNGNLSLSPMFSTQGDGHHFEITIPWNVITAGNGKPDMLRAVMYQDDNASGNCNAGNPNPFVYGESPWGTGISNEGPKWGVNDGTPTSARQPAGCGSGLSAATRWWGRYPITAGIGANSYCGPIVYIPDANFKNALLDDANINTNRDEEIQVAEAEAYTDTIDVSSMGISDLTGIEAFTALTFLN